MDVNRNRNTGQQVRYRSLIETAVLSNWDCVEHPQPEQAPTVFERVVTAVAVDLVGELVQHLHGRT